MQDVGFVLATILFGTMIAGVVVIGPLWLVLSLAAPKSLMSRYFKEPHFAHSETIIFSVFPGFLLRTIIFAWTLVLQHFGFKSFRNLEGIRQAMPAWYAYALYFFIYYTMLSLILVVILFAVLLSDLV